MKYDADSDQVVLIRLEIKNYREQMNDKVSCGFGWKAEEKSDMPRCFAVHLSDAIQKLFTSQYDLQSVRDSMVGCLDDALSAYKQTRIDPKWEALLDADNA